MKSNLLSHLLTVCAMVCTLGLSVWGQTSRPTAASGVAGTLDPKTGIFTAFLPAVAQDPAESSFAATTYNGKLIVNITITLATNFPTTSSIICDVSTRVFDNPAGGGNFLSEGGGVTATRSGSTGTCTIAIPYSWPLVTGSADTMTLSYTVGTFGPLSPGPTTRNSSQGIGTFKIPSPGTTSTFTVKSTI